MRRHLDLIIIGFLIWLGLWIGAKAEVWLCVARETNSHFPNPDRQEIWDSCEFTHQGFPRSFFR